MSRGCRASPGSRCARCSLAILVVFVFLFVLYFWVMAVTLYGLVEDVDVADVIGVVDCFFRMRLACSLRHFTVAVL